MQYEAHIKGGKDIAKLVHNPSLSARLRSKKVSRNRHLLFFIPWHKFTCRQRCEKQKIAACRFLRSWACKGPCGEQKGKVLSRATIGSVVANSPSPLAVTYKELIFNLIDFFCAQKVAPKCTDPVFIARHFVPALLY